METQATYNVHGSPNYCSIEDLELTWSQDENPQTNIKNIIYLLCHKMSLFGEESVFVFVNTSTGYSIYDGSDFGREFLQCYPDMQLKFQKFCLSHVRDGSGRLVKICGSSDGSPTKEESIEDKQFEYNISKRHNEGETNSIEQGSDDIVDVYCGHYSDDDDIIDDNKMDDNDDVDNGVSNEGSVDETISEGFQMAYQRVVSTDNTMSIFEQPEDASLIAENGLEGRFSTVTTSIKKENDILAEDISDVKSNTPKNVPKRKSRSTCSTIYNKERENTADNLTTGLGFKTKTLTKSENSSTVDVKLKKCHVGDKSSSVSVKVSDKYSSHISADDKDRIKSEINSNHSEDSSISDNCGENKKVKYRSKRLSISANDKGRSLSRMEKRKLNYVNGKNTLTCKLCGKTFHRKSNLTEHQQTHKTKTSCLLCGEAFSFSYLRKHLKNLHNMKGILVEECKVCSRSNLTSQEDISNHSDACPGYYINKADYYKCDICDCTFRKNSNYNRHMSGHKKPSNYICSLCDVQFDTETELQSHNSSQHFEDQRLFVKLEIPCQFCDKEFCTLPLLKEHSFSIHKNTKIILRCKFCDQIFKHFKSYKNHVLYHNNASGFQCNICEKECRNPVTLKKHLLQHLPDNEKPFKCETCGKGFPSAANLRIHSVVHATSKQYICDFCGNRYRDNRLLQVHRRIHTGERPYKCRVCESDFRSWASLKQHRLIHEKPKSFMCDICGKCYTQKAQLRTHHKRHFGEDKVKCEICNIELASRESYKGHYIRQHLREEQIDMLGFKNVLKCVYCGKLMESKEKMRRHVRIHTGEKPFSCPHCDKSFSDKGNCNAHIKIHLNDRRHKCLFCGKGFIQKRSLRGHVKSCHNDCDTEEPYVQDIPSASAVQPVNEYSGGDLPVSDIEIAKDNHLEMLECQDTEKILNLNTDASYSY